MEWKKNVAMFHWWKEFTNEIVSNLIRAFSMIEVLSIVTQFDGISVRRLEKDERERKNKNPQGSTSPFLPRFSQN